MFENFKPCGNRVLVKLHKKEEKSAGGIILPSSTEEKARTGSILVVGPGNRGPEGAYIPLDVNVGDTVYLGRYTGTEYGNDHIIVREDELLGTIE